MTDEQRLKRRCKRNHPLDQRYIKHGRLWCKTCISDYHRRRFPLRSHHLPEALVALLRTYPLPAQQLNKIIHESADTIGDWLRGKYVREPWQIPRIKAALELGLIEDHCYKTNGSKAESRE